MEDKKNSSTNTTTSKVPDTYTHRGAQTPNYTPPPMPKTAPVKQSNELPKK